MKINIFALLTIAVVPIVLSANPDNITSEETVEVRWNVDAPDKLTVKKSSRRSNVKNAYEISREEADEMVRQHNYLRTIVQPTAAKMRKMSWDEELATVATRYTRKCIYEHNKARSHSRFPYIGENLYISTGIPLTTDLLIGVVSAWDGEKVDYDYETRKCKPGMKCGHYTQTAWDDSFKVGCGLTICKKVNVDGVIWTDATLVGCNYGPGGNYDRHPFVAGRSCSACDEGDVCEDNLCANRVRDEDSDGSSATWNEWSSWSKCSKTCIGGMATRTRTCSSFVEGDCDGESREHTFTCSNNLCGFGGFGNANDKDFLPWGEWGECSKTCGHGISIRTRKCKNPMRCSGVNRLSNACYKRACPAPGTETTTSHWGRWGRWETCSVTCGKGVQVKKRSCEGGSSCSGNSEMKKGCRTSPCVTGPVWTTWTGWSVCSASCGRGTKLKTRRCLTGRDCVGESEIKEPCTRRRCPAIWSNWSVWSACSASCGVGAKRKTRTCTTGRNCEGASETTDVCNTIRCPDKYTQWNSWSSCSKTCGTATKTRTRSCIGSNDCRGTMLDRQPCELQMCPVFGSWSNWELCDVECGSGNRIRTRTCSSPNANDCDGVTTESIECHMKTCTTTGWSLWSRWGACSVSCGGGQRISTRVCNIGNSGPSTCSGDNSRSKSCNRNKCPTFSVWSKWSACDADCGEGTKTRSRECQNGNNCDGENIDTEPCKNRDCRKSTWDKWTTWTRCSGTCGEGSQSRTRLCLFGDGPPCTGENKDVRICELQSCDKNEKDPPNKGPNERNKVPNESDGSSEKKDGGGASSITSSSLQLLILTCIVFIFNNVFIT